MEKEANNPILDSLVKLVTRTAPAFLPIQTEVLSTHLNGEAVQEQLGAFLNDTQSQIAIFAVLNGQVTVTTALDALGFRGQGVGYLKNPAAGPDAFHLLNLGNLAQTSLSGILGPVFGQVGALRRQVAAGDAAKVILGSHAKISSFETQIVAKEDQATPDELFKFHRAVLEVGPGLQAGITGELGKKVLLPEDAFEGAGAAEGFNKLTDIVAYIHNTATILANQKGVNTGSETAYADLIDKLAGHIEKKSGQANPVDNLESADTEVKELQTKLLGIKDQLVQGQNKARELLTSVTQAKNQAEAQVEVINNQKEGVETKVASLQEIKQTLEQKLLEVQSLVEKTRSEAMQIRAEELVELRSFSKPPKTAVLVMEALILILNRKKPSWKTVKAELQYPKRFMVKIFDYDCSKFSEKLKNKLQKDYIGGPEWNPYKIKATSLVCEAIAAWINAQLKIHDLNVEIAPLKQTLKEIQEELGNGPQDLEAVKKQLEVAQENVATHQKAFEAAQEEIQKLRAEVDEVRNQITEKVKAAGGEVPEQETAAGNTENAAGDSLLAAAIQTYLGELDDQSKNLLIDNWRRLLEREGLKFDKEASVAGELNGQAIQFNVKQDVLDALLKVPTPQPAPVQAVTAPTPTPAPFQAPVDTAKIQAEFVEQLKTIQNEFFEKLKAQQ